MRSAHTPVLGLPRPEGGTDVRKSSDRLGQGSALKPALFNDIIVFGQPAASVQDQLRPFCSRQYKKSSVATYRGMSFIQPGDSSSSKFVGGDIHMLIAVHFSVPVF